MSQARRFAAEFTPYKRLGVAIELMGVARYKWRQTMSQTLSTTVSVYEYGEGDTPVQGTVTPAVGVDPGAIWDNCVYALGAMMIDGKMGYKSGQTKKSPASPKAWSGPGTNLGAGAQGTKWKESFKAQPHIHLGNSDGRAVIGYAVVPGTGGKYASMNIYIGQEG
jgi:hypothetical protein